MRPPNDLQRWTRTYAFYVVPVFACILLAQALPVLAAPVVSTISPASADTNQTVSCTITGSGFGSSGTPTVQLQMSGQTSITATGVVRASSSRLNTCTFNLTGAVAGAWTVAVTVSGVTGTKSNAFTVYAPPIATSITPNTGVNTGSVSITNLAGSNFRTGDTVTLTQTGQTTITATGVTIVSSSQITCTLNLTGAATGTWNVVVTDSNSFSSTITNGFTVIVPPVPNVTSITPTTGVAGSSVNLTINGSNFSTDDFAELEKTGESGTGSTITSVTPTQIQCTITLPNTDANVIGLWDVRVWNSLQQGSTLPAAFNVTAPPAPTVTSISPNTGTQSTYYYYPVTITGTNFVYADTVVLRKAGQTDIPFGSESWLGSTQFTFSLSYSASTAGGYWDVVVTDPFGQTGTLSNGFYIPPPPAPTLTSVSPTTASNGLTSVAMTLTGSSFYNGDVVTITQSGGGASLPISGLTVSSLTKITLNVNPQGQPVGAYDVSVSNGFATPSTKVGAFTLTAPAAISLTSMTPDYETNNSASYTAIKVYGSGIQTGASIKFQLGTNTPLSSVGSVSVHASPNYIQCAPYFAYAGNPYGTPAPVGAYTVTVTNPDGGTASIAPFNVESYATPTPTGVSPNPVSNDGVKHLTITGTGFFVAPDSGGAPMTVILRNSVNSSDVIYATNVSASTTTQLTCDVDVTGKGYGLANPWSIQVCPPNDGNPSNQSSGGAVTGGNTLTPGLYVTNSTPFTVTSISPNNGSTQTTITGVTITGTGFVGYPGQNNAGLAAQFVQHGGTAVIPTNVVYYVSSTSITANIMTSTAGLPLGLYDLNVTNSDGSTASLPSCFTLYASPSPVLFPPSPTTTAPNTGPTVTLTFMATGLVAGSVPHLTMSGQPDIVGDNVVVNLSGSQTIACTFQLWGVKAGTWNCIVVQPDGNWGGRPGNVFTVTEVAPTLTSITPNTGTNNGPVTTTLVGTNLAPQDTVKLQMGGQPDILGSTLTSVTHTQAGCTFDLTGVASGAWNVVLTDLSGSTATIPGGFTVTNPPPTVTAITPNSGAANTVVGITNLAGTGFLSGASAKLSKTGQTDIAASSVTVVSPTEITCSLNLTGAAAGAWDVVVTNTDTQSGTLPGGFTVSPGAPTMTALPTYTIGTSLTCSWTGIAPGSTHSKVQCSTDPAFGTVLQDSGWLAVPTNSYTFTGLTIGTKYYYRAQVGVLVGGTPITTSHWSNEVFSTQRSATPVLTYTGDTTNVFGNPVTLSAQLTSSGTPVQGNTVQFIVGGSTYTGVTGADGTASASVPPNLLQPGTYTVYCQADAGQGYAAVNATGTLVVSSAVVTDTIISDNGYFVRNTKRCTILFSYSKNTGEGSLYYTDLGSPLTRIVAGDATSVTLSPNGHTATISGPCTVNGVASTFTLQVTDTTNTVVSLRTASGYSAGPAVMASGVITFAVY